MSPKTKAEPKKSPWEVLGIISEDDEIKKFGVRLDAVRYKKAGGRYLCWSEDLDAVMRTFNAIEGKLPAHVWEIKRAKSGPRTGEPYCNCPAWRFPKKIKVETAAGTQLIQEERFCKHLGKLAKDGVEIP